MKNNHKIFLEVADVIPIIQKYRDEKKKIVLTQGSFDLIHIGHARYCKQAKACGDVLIVGVESDEKVRARKGEDRPIVPESERMEMLTYFDSVDLVVLKKLDAPKLNLMKAIHPDVLVATEETYTTQAQIDEVKKHCKELVILKPQATTSTSAQLRRVQLGLVKHFAETVSMRVIDVLEDAIEELRRGGKKNAKT